MSRIQFTNQRGIFRVGVGVGVGGVGVVQMLLKQKEGA